MPPFLLEAVPALVPGTAETVTVTIADVVIKLGATALVLRSAAMATATWACVRHRMPLFSVEAVRVLAIGTAETVTVSIAYVVGVLELRVQQACSVVRVSVQWGVALPPTLLFRRAALVQLLPTASLLPTAIVHFAVFDWALGVRQDLSVVRAIATWDAVLSRMRQFRPEEVVLPIGIAVPQAIASRVDAVSGLDTLVDASTPRNAAHRWYVLAVHVWYRQCPVESVVLVVLRQLSAALPMCALAEGAALQPPVRWRAEVAHPVRLAAPVQYAGQPCVSARVDQELPDARTLQAVSLIELLLIPRISVLAHSCS